MRAYQYQGPRPRGTEQTGTRQRPAEAPESAHLVLDIADLLLDILLRPGSPGCERGTAKATSACLALRMAAHPLNNSRPHVRDVLAKSRDFSKIVHGCVSESSCFAASLCLGVCFVVVMVVPGELVEPAHAPATLIRVPATLGPGPWTCAAHASTPTPLEGILTSSLSHTLSITASWVQCLCPNEPKLHLLLLLSSPNNGTTNTHP